VKFLVDQNRSPRLAELLREAGHDAVHTLELGFERAEDDELIKFARAHGRVVISGDTDFGALLALANETSPSVILFRQRQRRLAEDQASLLLAHLGELSEDLERGAIVIFEDGRIRVRKLPLLPPEES
jgi:predicted nuclease of predicted toxin-antitoxin system